MKTGAAREALTKDLIRIYGASEAEAIATLVLEELTGVPRGARAAAEEEWSGERVSRFIEWKERLMQEEPVQYILGKAHFYGLDLYVDGSVLIPRPETEELVHWILSDLKAAQSPALTKGALSADLTSTLKILDVGSGSGCIALALKRGAPRAEVWGCEVSEAALNVARRNAAMLDIRVDFQGLDFLDEAQWKSLPPADLLVSNPPYIPKRELESMHGNVVRYEPHGALFVPDEDPLLFYRALAGFAKHRLQPEGRLYLEIHESLGNEVSGLFRSEGFASVELRKDMQGKDRMMRAGMC